jgi:hypothetical protein
MRTYTTEHTVYTFAELSEKAQENAISSLSDINVDYNWYDAVYDGAERIGLRITEFDLDQRRYAKGNFTLSACEVAQNIFNEHIEDCETRKTAESFMEKWQPVFDSYMDESGEEFESRESEDKLLDLESAFLKSLCEDYSIILEKEYEYLTSEEAIIETIEASNYEFYENGELA